MGGGCFISGFGWGDRGWVLSLSVFFVFVLFVLFSFGLSYPASFLSE